MSTENEINFDKGVEWTLQKQKRALSGAEWAQLFVIKQIRATLSQHNIIFMSSYKCLLP